MRGASVVAVALFALMPQGARGWFDTSKDVLALLEEELPVVEEHHSPQEGTQSLRRRERDADRLVLLMNSIRYRQTPPEKVAEFEAHVNGASRASSIPPACSPASSHMVYNVLSTVISPSHIVPVPRSAHRTLRRSHRLAPSTCGHAGAPQIGIITPRGGPTSGGTFVQATGVNLAGGDVYKCRFGQEMVPGNYHLENNTVTCIAPRQPMGTKRVRFAIGVFFKAEMKAHHIVSGEVDYTYYGELSIPQSERISKSVTLDDSACDPPQIPKQPHPSSERSCLALA